MAVDTSRWIVGKAQTSPDKYIDASMRVMDTTNKMGKERPFNYNVAVNQFRGWIYAAVWMNAKAMATVKLRMYVRSRAGEKLVNSRSLRKVDPLRRRYLMGMHKRRQPSDYVLRKTLEWGGEFEEVAEKHPITELLAKPNNYMGGFEFACVRHMMASLTGNFYMHPVVEGVRYNGNALTRIKQLWVMPSQYVKIIPGEAHSEELVSGYVYGADSQVQRRFEPDEVKHLRFPNPKNMWYGLGQVEADWDAQKLTIAQRETDQAKYDNLARPDLAVITKSANVDIGKLKELQEEWARLFRGTFRQGSPVFLTGDTQVIPLNWQPTEQGSREIVIEEHAAVFGVPVSLLKANDPNLASAQVGFASWRENTILPYCRLDEEFLNTGIIPIYGIEDDAFLCYDDPVPENRDEIRQDIATAMQWGTKTRNEARVMSGDEAIDDENADKLLVPAGLVPIEKVGEQSALGTGWALPGGNDKPSVDDEEPGDEQGKRLHKSIIIRQSAHIYAKGDADSTARDGEKEKPIRQMTAALAKVFNAQRREAIAILTGRKDRDADSDIREIIEAMAKYNEDIADAITPFMSLQLLNGGAAGLERIDLPADTFAVTNPRVDEFLRHYAIKLAREVNTYTAQRLSETLAEGVKAGESASKLAGRVGSLYDDFDGYRTEMIARTESARAFSAGTEQAWKESGVVAGKRWMLAAGGCVVCSAIAKHHNDAVPLSEPFLPMGYQLPLSDGKTFLVDYSAIQGPPGHPHCRCALEPELRETT